MKRSKTGCIPNDLMQKIPEKKLTRWPDDEQVGSLMGSALLVRYGLTAEDIKSLLQWPGTQFVVGNIGAPLEWIPKEKCFEFWESDVKAHLCERRSFNLEDYPGDYCFIASKWVMDSKVIIFLFKCH